MINRAEALREVSVLDPDGNRVRLGGLWADRPIVLVFIRHFGCMFCREQVAQYRSALAEIRGAGAELVVVGNGAPHYARGFRDSEKIQFPLYTDPALVAYEAARLRRGLSTSFNVGTVKNALRALRGGFLQGTPQGDVWQQGGVFVLGPKDQEHYGYVSQEAGDHPPVADVLAAVRRAVPERLRETSSL